MKLLLENWRFFTEETKKEDLLFNELKDMCLSFRAGTLITERVAQKQFLVELEKLYTLYEAKGMTRRQFLKNAGAAAIAAGTLTGGGAAMGALGNKLDREHEELAAKKKAREEKEKITYDDDHKLDIRKDLSEWPLSPPPKGMDVRDKVGSNFVWIHYDDIGPRSGLGKNSPYGTAQNYYKHIKTLSPSVLKKMLIGKDSGAIFGSGTNAYYVEYGKSDFGEDILPLEWSLAFKAFEEKTRRPDYKDSSSWKSIFKFQ
tara:strand:- start:41 stop:814 length:774 start_codon:yes stop_codon:yes gene_type:complete